MSVCRASGIKWQHMRNCCPDHSVSQAVGHFPVGRWKSKRLFFKAVTAVASSLPFTIEVNRIQQYEVVLPLGTFHTCLKLCSLFYPQRKSHQSASRGRHPPAQQTISMKTGLKTRTKMFLIFQSVCLNQKLSLISSVNRQGLNQSNHKLTQSMIPAQPKTNRYSQNQALCLKKKALYQSK